MEVTTKESPSNSDETAGSGENLNEKQQEETKVNLESKKSSDTEPKSNEEEDEDKRNLDEDHPQKDESNQVQDGSKSDKPPQLKLHFLAVGGAPILKKNKFQVRETMTIAEVVMFLRKTLKIREGDPLFLYINSSFAPGLDQALKCLHDSFNVGGELVMQYAITSSWG